MRDRVPNTTDPARAQGFGEPDRIIAKAVPAVTIALSAGGLSLALGALHPFATLIIMALGVSVYPIRRLAALSRVLALLAAVPVAVSAGIPIHLTVGSRHLPIALAEMFIWAALSTWLLSRPRPNRKIMKASLVLLATTLPGAFLASDIGAYLGGLRILTVTLVIVIMMTDSRLRMLLASKQEWLRLFGLSAAWMGASISMQLVLRNRVFESAVMLEEAAVWKRASDLAWGRSNYLAALMVLGIAFALAVLLEEKTSQGSPLWNAGTLAGILLSLPGFVATGSRTQSIALGAVAMTAVAVKIYRTVGSSRRVGRKVTRLGAVGLISLPVLFIGSPFLSLMWEQVTRADTVLEFRTVVGRYQIWSLAWERFIESPLVGSGLMTPLGITEESGMAHNVLLQILAEVGTLGLAAIAIYVIIILQTLRSAGRISAYYLLPLVAFVVGSVAENTVRTYQYDMALFVLGLAAASGFRSKLRDHHACC